MPLTELGHEQAAGGRGASSPALRPGALISSDLLRAVQTAEHCARATGLAFTTTPALREQGYGVLEGRPSRELWDVVDWTDPHWSAEGGESLAELHARVAAYLARPAGRPARRGGRAGHARRHHPGRPGGASPGAAPTRCPR